MITSLSNYAETEHAMTLALGSKIVDGFPVTLCPPGCAAGCFEIRSRGKGPDYMLVDRWPNPSNFRLTSGGERKWRSLNYGPLYFQQEIYVYHRELGMAMQSAFDALKTEVAEEMHDLTCPECQQPFKSTRKRKYCSMSCTRKANAWRAGRRLMAEHRAAATEELRLAMAGCKPTIVKAKKCWMIRLLNPAGTYTKVRRHFGTFYEALNFIAEVKSVGMPDMKRGCA